VSGAPHPSPLPRGERKATNPRPRRGRGQGEGVTIGVDVGGTTVAVGLVGADGQVLEHGQAPTHARGAGTALETIVDLIERLQDAARARGVSVTGVGVGVPGIVDAERGTVGRDIHYVPELVGVPLADLLGRRLGLPVFVDNDVNVLTLAEWMWGAGRGARSLVMLALGTGVGGGIMWFSGGGFPSFRRAFFEPIRVNLKLLTLIGRARSADPPEWLDAFAVRASVVVIPRGFRAEDFGAIPGTFQTARETLASFSLVFDAEPLVRSLRR